MSVTEVAGFALISSLAVSLVLVILLQFAKRLVPKDATLARQCSAVFHHLTVGALSAAFLADLVSFGTVSIALLLELGFEIADTVFSLAGSGWIGLHGAPLYLHHAVSIVLECLLLDLLLEYGTIVQPHIARILLVEVGSGGVDLLCSKVLPKWGLRPYSAPQWLVLGLYTAWFVGIRVVLFARSIPGFLGLVGWARPHLLWVWYAAVVLFALYHALLAVGLVFVWRNGGKMPKRHAEATK